MWAYLGLLSLGALLWWQIHFRWTGRWKGKDVLAPGADARVRALFVKNKDTLIALEFGCAVPTHLRFELKRETGVDRFFKWVGLAVERQFGQSKFDQLVYVARTTTTSSNSSLRTKPSSTRRPAARHGRPHLRAQKSGVCQRAPPCASHHPEPVQARGRRDAHGASRIGLEWAPAGHRQRGA
jgi:hypothetical protein